MFKSLFRKDSTPSQPLLTTTIRLQNDLWVIHPPPEDALTSNTLGDDTIMLSGVASFVSDAHVQIWTVRVALVLQYSYRCSKTQEWKQGIIYEQGQTFDECCAEQDGSPQVLQVFLDKRDKSIKRRIEFGILLPRSLATYEHLPHAKMIPQVRVSVEFSKLTWTAAELAALPPSPPVYVDKEETNMIAGRRFVSESWRGGSVLIEREGESTSFRLLDHPCHPLNRRFLQVLTKLSTQLHHCRLHRIICNKHGSKTLPSRQTLIQRQVRDSSVSRSEE